MNVQETVITDTHLLYRAGGSGSETTEASSNIVYELTRSPARGTLILTPLAGASNGNAREQQQRKLKVGSKFSQVDLLAGHLKYRYEDGKI